MAQSWTDKLIHKFGTDTIIVSNYKTTSNALQGDKILYFEDTTNLLANKILIVDSESYVIHTVNKDINMVILTRGLTTAKSAGSRFTITESCHSKLVSSIGRTIVQDISEYTKLVKVIKSLSVNFGGLVDRDGVKYFIIGIISGRNSHTLRLKEINAYVTLQQPVRATPATPVFGKRTEFETLGVVPAYINVLTSQANQEVPGITPKTVTLCLIDDKYEVSINSRIIADRVYKVIGLDNYNYKNMRLLTLDLDTNRQV